MSAADLLLFLNFERPHREYIIFLQNKAVQCIAVQNVWIKNWTASENHKMMSMNRKLKLKCIFHKSSTLGVLYICTSSGIEAK